jgi:hypothetical protein
MLVSDIRETMLPTVDPAALAGTRSIRAPVLFQQTVHGHP